ncbi:MAG: hypothetical protein JWQ76_2422 [Ramlibacter sp.]|nr:hypothetical protein [Ramlibacter sp.]
MAGGSINSFARQRRCRIASSRSSFSIRGGSIFVHIGLSRFGIPREGCSTRAGSRFRARVLFPHHGAYLVAPDQQHLGDVAAIGAHRAGGAGYKDGEACFERVGMAFPWNQVLSQGWDERALRTEGRSHRFLARNRLQQQRVCHRKLHRRTRPQGGQGPGGLPPRNAPAQLAKDGHVGTGGSEIGLGGRRCRSAWDAASAGSLRSPASLPPWCKRRSMPRAK